MAAPPLIWSFISLVIGFLLRSLSGGPELLPAALGLGVSDCTPPALRGPYFLRRVPVNDFNWAASAAFTGSKKMCFLENFSTKWIKRVTFRGEIATSGSLLTIVCRLYIYWTRADVCGPGWFRWGLRVESLARYGFHWNNFFLL